MELSGPSEEHWGRRLAYLALAVGLAGLLLVFDLAYCVPAHQGVDQNGYLVGGRLLAEQGTMKLDPRNPDTGKVDPFVYVGRMWVGAELGSVRERFYPKYPIGLPAIYAIVWKVGGAAWVYRVSPVAMSLAVIGVFLLVRTLACSVMAFLAAVVFASSPLTLELANNPNSHAVTVCCIAWGMFLLIRWWQNGGVARIAGAGLLLGYGVTIRYTEGLMVLPLAYLLIDRAWRHVRIRDWSAAGEGLVGGMAWSVPVLVLCIYNLRAMGTLTGYDPTNESTGFAWKYFVSPGSWSSFNWFAGNWHAMLHQLHDIALAFVFPIGLLGLVLMFRFAPRVAVAMGLWMVPTMVVYGMYYWAPDRNDAILEGTNAVAIPAVGYLRFFATILPGLLVCAFAGLSRLRLATSPPSSSPDASSPFVAAAGLLTVLAVLVGVRGGIAFDERDQYQREVLGFNAREVERAVAGEGVEPKSAVVFCSGRELINQLQFATAYRLYDAQMFTVGGYNLLVRDDAGANDPQALDPNRREALRRHVQELMRQGNGGLMRTLERASQEIVESALEHGRGVFVVGEKGEALFAARQLADPRRFESRVVASWTAAVPAPPERGREIPRAPRRRPGLRRLEMPGRMAMEVVRIAPRAKGAATAHSSR